MVGRDPVVAGERDLEAAAERRAVDRRDERLAALLHAVEPLVRAARDRLGLLRRHPDDLVEVGAGDERVGLGAREDAGDDRLVVLDLLHERPGLLEHLAARGR